MSVLPLVAGDLDAPLAWRAGRPIVRRRYLADVLSLARQLPAQGPMLNLTEDRYSFAVGLGAAMLRGQYNLMPPTHTPDTVERLHKRFPSAYAMRDARAGAPSDAAAGDTMPVVRFTASDDVQLPAEAPLIDAGATTALVLTSGSTGEPQPHAKQWGALTLAMEVGARRLAHEMGLPGLAGVTLVATVPAQHMYGFESTVLIAMLGQASFDADRPFFPADIVAALARAARPRMLVSTPFHLKMLLDAGLALPPVDLVLCATAPLSPQLAQRAEAAMGGPLIEIYGCTEAGQVATRRTTAGPQWRTYDGLRITGNGEQALALGAHVLVPTPLADVLDVLDDGRFLLLGRSNDLINIAGKRNSIGHLNYHLNSIPGVQDGAFWLPPDDAGDSAGIVRLVAFVVAPGIPAATLRHDILVALRQRVDAAFLPRRIVSVDVLPREPGTGKLPATRFAAWAMQRLQQQADPQGPGSDRHG